MYILRITFKSIKNLNNLQNLKKKLFYINKTPINQVINIKNKNKIFTILKSPHVNKKSREHFLYKNYTKKINIKFLNFIQLLNFIIIIKKTLIENTIIKIKIIKY